jgi:hypothetical protein
MVQQPAQMVWNTPYGEEYNRVQIVQAMAFEVPEHPDLVRLGPGTSDSLM